MISKDKIILFFFLCALVVPVNVHAQGGVTMKTKANLLDTVIVEIESGIEILFMEEMDSYVVSPLGTETSNPALIRVSGAPVEAMIDIEFQQANGQGILGNQSVTISEFNVLGKESGSSVNIMPFSDDGALLLTIGGTVTDVDKTDEFYTGVNVLNINYL